MPEGDTYQSAAWAGSANNDAINGKLEETASFFI